MSTKHTIAGGDKLRLHVREWGNATGIPILFIHGWSGSHLAWRYQYESALTDEFRIVALDLRGHGMSEAPLEAGNYTEAPLWADDIAAIIEELDLDRPVLVGWSYGGFVIGDYVRAYGCEAISGVNFAGGGVKLNEAALSTLYGPGFLGHVEGATQLDLPTNIEAIRQFVRALVASPMTPEDFDYTLAYNVVVPPEVRGALLAREIDHGDVLQAMRVPVLVTQGEVDQHVLPAMAEHILQVCPTAKGSWYEGVAHMPFLENPRRFNAELAKFARDTRD
ncbi:alpha/beta hydrolase [Billgrantia azerbaijanica]|nr:alpha/beta hydrolase [Halomonas azerbaijanica]